MPAVHDPLLDLFAQLLADVLEVDGVEIELAALGQVALRGRSGELVGAEVAVTAPRARLCIVRSGRISVETIELARGIAEQLGRAASRFSPPLGALSVREEVGLIKEHRVLEALHRSGWNVGQAARLLRVARVFVYRVAEKLRLRRREELRIRS